MEKYDIILNLAGQEFILEEEILLDEIPEKLNDWEDKIKPVVRKNRGL